MEMSNNEAYEWLKEQIFNSCGKKLIPSINCSGDINALYSNSSNILIEILGQNSYGAVFKIEFGITGSVYYEDFKSLAKRFDIKEQWKSEVE